MKCKITHGEIHNLGSEGDEVEVSEAVYHSFADKLEVLDNEDVTAHNAGETAASVEHTPDREAPEAAGEEDSGERDQSIEKAETAASAPETVSEGEADASQNMPDMGTESAGDEDVDLSEMSVADLKEWLNEHEDDLSDEDLDAMYEAEENGEGRATAKDAIDAKRS